jgi:cytochrome oxidase Cu insertion factor (SCO1/SenC/PrrC family)
MQTVVRAGLVLLAGVFVGGFVWMLLSSSSSPSGEWVGKPAPPTQGTDAAGAAFQLSDYRGQVVLLDFWGNW